MENSSIFTIWLIEIRPLYSEWRMTTGTSLGGDKKNQGKDEKSARAHLIEIWRWFDSGPFAIAVWGFSFGQFVWNFEIADSDIAIAQLSWHTLYIHNNIIRFFSVNCLSTLGYRTTVSERRKCCCIRFNQFITMRHNFDSIH